MSNLDILLAGDRMAWLDREARSIQRRALAKPMKAVRPVPRTAPPAPPRLQPLSR